MKAYIAAVVILIGGIVLLLNTDRVHAQTFESLSYHQKRADMSSQNNRKKDKPVHAIQDNTSNNYVNASYELAKSAYQTIAPVIITYSTLKSGVGMCNDMYSAANTIKEYASNM